MAWTIELDPHAARQIAKLPKQDAVRIRDFLRDRVALSENPRAIGQALQGSRFAGVWRYRVGDFRILCEIHDRKLVVLVIAIGNRREIYR